MATGKKKASNAKKVEGGGEPSKKIINTAPEVGVVKIADLKEAPYNPREISDSALAGLERSLERFGYVDLMIVNKRSMRVIGGHQRLKILQSNGIEQIPAVLVDFSEDEEQTLNITLNNQQIMGAFTKAIIPMLEKLRVSMPDDYLALRLKELRKDLTNLETENTGAGKTLPDDIPAVPKKAITKPGDIWILGDHRLMCGSSTNAEDVKKLFAGEGKAKLFSTDPPYCVDYTGADRPNGGKDWSKLFKEKEIVDAGRFWFDFLSVGFEFVENNSAIYLWHASKRFDVILEISKALNLLIHQTIIWVKPCAVFSFSIYPWKHEPCVFCWRAGSKPEFDHKKKQMGTTWRVDFVRSGDQSDPETYSDIWEVDYEGKKRSSGIHPTVKPTEVFAIPMRVHTQPGDICYEPFSGSGSQIIAGERVHRRVFAMEIEPVFVDVAVKRWEEFTGKKAERIKA